MTNWSFNENRNKKKKLIIAGITVAVVVVAIIIGVVLVVNKSKPEDKKTNRNTLTEEELNADPEEVIAQETEEVSGADVDVTKIVSENETDEITLGIDVAKYQGTIDWQQVANSGIDLQWCVSDIVLW